MSDNRFVKAVKAICYMLFLFACVFHFPNLRNQIILLNSIPVKAENGNHTVVQKCCINKPRFLKNGFLFFNLIVFNKTLQNSYDFSHCCIIFQCKFRITHTVYNIIFFCPNNSIGIVLVSFNICKCVSSIYFFFGQLNQIVQKYFAQ